ncbi:MAG: hypothetical protein ABIM43_05045 [candidate division WOR-3 bacterium]
MHKKNVKAIMITLAIISTLLSITLLSCQRKDSIPGRYVCIKDGRVFKQFEEIEFFEGGVGCLYLQFVNIWFYWSQTPSGVEIRYAAIDQSYTATKSGGDLYFNDGSLFRKYDPKNMEEVLQRVREAIKNYQP